MREKFLATDSKKKMNLFVIYFWDKYCFGKRSTAKKQSEKEIKFVETVFERRAKKNIAGMEKGRKNVINFYWYFVDTRKRWWKLFHCLSRVINQIVCERIQCCYEVYTKAPLVPGSSVKWNEGWASDGSKFTPSTACSLLEMGHKTMESSS